MCIDTKKDCLIRRLLIYIAVASDVAIVAVVAQYNKCLVFCQIYFVLGAKRSNCNMYDKMRQFDGYIQAF